jgi:hypothetical protein
LIDALQRPRFITSRRFQAWSRLLSRSNLAFRTRSGDLNDTVDTSKTERMFKVAKTGWRMFLS